MVWYLGSKVLGKPIDYLIAESFFRLLEVQRPLEDYVKKLSRSGFIDKLEMHLLVRAARPNECFV